MVDELHKETIVEDLKQNDILQKELEILDNVSLESLDKYKKEYSTAIPKGVIKQNGIDVEIEQKMNYYKELLKADRVLLFEFHNGQHYSSYRSALKMSPSYEVFRAGLDSIRNECSNLPIAVMPNYLAEIINNGYSYCSDIENIKGIMNSTYSFKKALNIRAYYDRAIKDEEGNIQKEVAIPSLESFMDTINEKMALILDDATDQWGIKVLIVTKLIMKY